MGQSTDAIICYGINFGEVIEEGDYDYDEVERAGNILGAMREEGEPHEGLVLVAHCSDGYRMHILAIEGTEQRAYRGEPEVIKPMAEPPPEWRAKLARFCADHDLAFSEPQWLLCSDWS